MKKTKIICSIGPASNDVDILTDMAIHGMNVARINFSHGDYEEKDKFLENIVKVRENTGKQVGILWILEVLNLELVNLKMIKLI